MEGVRKEREGQGRLTQNIKGRAARHETLTKRSTDGYLPTWNHQPAPFDKVLWNRSDQVMCMLSPLATRSYPAHRNVPDQHLASPNLARGSEPSKMMRERDVRSWIVMLIRKTGVGEEAKNLLTCSGRDANVERVCRDQRKNRRNRTIEDPQRS